MTRTFARDLAASRMFLMEDDVLQIQRLVRMLSETLPPNVVDLGAGSGTTSLSVLDEREDALITTFDISPANIEWARLAVLNAYPGCDWSGIVSDAALAARQYTRLVDLLLHDASHEREHVEADLRAWLPLVRTGGLIWVHDYGDPPEAWGQPSSPGVKEAVDLLVAEGEIVPLDQRTVGMGWVGVKP